MLLLYLLCHLYSLLLSSRCHVSVLASSPVIRLADGSLVGLDSFVGGTALLDVEAGLRVDVALDARCRLDVIVALQKFVEALNRLAHVLNRHVTVLVEVETHPVVLCKHSHIRVGLLDVVPERGLVLPEHPHEQSHKVARFVHKKHNFLVDLWQGFVQLSGESEPAVFDLLVLGDVVNIRVCVLVHFRRLKVLDAATTLEEPQVDQVPRDHPQLIEIALGLGDRLYTGILFAKEDLALGRLGVQLLNPGDDCFHE